MTFTTIYNIKQCIFFNILKNLVSKYMQNNDRSLSKKAICRIFSKHARCVIWMPWNIKSTKSLIGQSENLKVSSSAVYLVHY